MTTLRDAAQQALEALCLWATGRDMDAVALNDLILRLEAALAEPVQEPVAWSHNLIDIIITHRPADLERHPERWTALYSAPQPCPTCEALARTVMLDQTSHDTAPPQRKPLTEVDLRALYDRHAAHQEEGPEASGWWAFARAIERAHGIGEQK